MEAEDAASTRSLSSGIAKNDSTNTEPSSMMVAVGSGPYQISTIAATDRIDVLYANHASPACRFLRVPAPGVLMSVATSMVSLGRGTPRVTLSLKTPA